MLVKSISHTVQPTDTVTNNNTVCGNEAQQIVRTNDDLHHRLPCQCEFPPCLLVEVILVGEAASAF